MARMLIASTWLVALSTTAALAQTPPSYDFDFVTVGDAGNAACDLPDPGGTSYAQGRGSVGYEYRIGRTEITTAQWMEFINHYSTLGGSWTLFGLVIYSGMEIDQSYKGPGLKYKLRNVPDAEVLPVGGITWREAAMFCNWLHNGKVPTIASVMDGAYDASTFTKNPDGTFNDQLTHHPSAKYWIPTFDEWIKAAHYDPDRHGPGEGGWWMYPIGSDAVPNYGPPGVGEANAAFELPGNGQWDIPLGAYPESTSPWGLLDAAGAAGEWTEGYSFEGTPEQRWWEGSTASTSHYLSELGDRVTRLSAADPWSGGVDHGFRIASSVPCPGSLLLFGVALLQRPRPSRRP